MEFKKELDELKQGIANNDNNVEISEDAEIEQEVSVQETKQEITVSNTSNFSTQVANNGLINALSNNDVAIQMAQDSYNALKNQKKIGKSIEKVVKKNTEVDIESADIRVQEKDKNNKVKKAEIKNELLRLKNEKTYLKREQRQKLAMQRAEHIREKYEDLLLRTCRKKTKGEDGKWKYHKDENGKDIINIPGKFKLFWLRLFDGIVSTLNQTAEIFGALNKNVLKGGFIILVLLLIFVPPFRSWLLGLIGINFG